MMNSMKLQQCDIQGRLFEHFGNEGYDSKSFISEFMKSEVAKGLDRKYDRMQWAGEEYLFEEIVENCKLNKSGVVWSNETLYWIGYKYRYWNFSRNASSREILKIASPELMKSSYLMFHTMDPEMAIDDLIQIGKERSEK